MPSRKTFFSFLTANFSRKNYYCEALYNPYFTNYFEKANPVKRSPEKNRPENQPYLNTGFWNKDDR